MYEIHTKAFMIEKFSTNTTKLHKNTTTIVTTTKKYLSGKTLVSMTANALNGITYFGQLLKSG